MALLESDGHCRRWALVETVGPWRYAVGDYVLSLASSCLSLLPSYQKVSTFLYPHFCHDILLHLRPEQRNQPAMD